MKIQPLISSIMIAAVLMLCRASGQTNAPVFISFTNSGGNFITNAEVRQVRPQGLIYATSSGGGFVDFTNLSAVIRQQFGYSEATAAAARKNDLIRRSQDRLRLQEQIQAAREQSAMGVQTSTAHPFQYSQRWLQGGVNLQPLFNWWGYAASAGPAGEPKKPLKSWDRITSQNFQVFQKGWILDAKIQSSPLTNRTAKIYLLNPPNEERQMFDSALAERGGLYTWWNTLSTVATADREDAEETDRREADVSLYRSQSGFLNNQFAGAAADLAADENSINASQQTVMGKIASIQARLAQLESYLNGFPTPGAYSVDMFAFDTGRSVSGMEIYDLGTITY